MKTRGKSIFLSLWLIGCLFLLPAFALAAPVGNFVEITHKAGFGSGMNKYSWSSVVFSKDNNLYIGTFNVNANILAAERYLTQIENTSPATVAQLAALDAQRRLWSGSPVTPSTGGEIWRYDTSKSIWMRVFKADSEHVGFREMIEYQGCIYAGTANGPNGPDPSADQYNGTTVTYVPGRDGTALYRSCCGFFWEKVPGGPSLNINNSSNRTMTVFDDKLWVGTENPIDGPELWSYDGSTWNLEFKFPLIPIAPGISISSMLAIGELAAYKGSLYLGTWGDVSKNLAFSLWKYPGTEGRPVDDVTPTFVYEGPDNDNQGVMQLYEFTGSDSIQRLYLGTVNYDDGFSFLRIIDPPSITNRIAAAIGADPGTGWEVITTNGFGREYPGVGTDDNNYLWSVQTIGGVNYIGLFNGDNAGSILSGLFGGDPLDLTNLPESSAQIWYSEDGKNWSLLEGAGFGNPFTYGFRTMNVVNGELVVGAATDMFFPDLFSTPYDTPEGVKGLFQTFGYALSDDVAFGLHLLFQGLDLFLPPYIGTRVYMSQPVVPE